VLERRGEPARALAELQVAREQGCGGWRTNWHLARLADRAGEAPLAERSLREVLAEVPGFEQARRIAARRGMS
jgi:hypothetical protein